MNAGTRPLYYPGRLFTAPAGSKEVSTFRTIGRFPSPSTRSASSAALNGLGLRRVTIVIALNSSPA